MSDDQKRRTQQAIWEAQREWLSASRMRDMSDRITATATDHALHASALGESEEDIEQYHRMLEQRGIVVPTRVRRRRRENEE